MKQAAVVPSTKPAQTSCKPAPLSTDSDSFWDSSPAAVRALDVEARISADQALAVAETRARSDEHAFWNQLSNASPNRAGRRRHCFNPMRLLSVAWLDVYEAWSMRMCVLLKAETANGTLRAGMSLPCRWKAAGQWRSRTSQLAAAASQGNSRAEQNLRQPQCRSAGSTALGLVCASQGRRSFAGRAPWKAGGESPPRHAQGRLRERPGCDAGGCQGLRTEKRPPA